LLDSRRMPLLSLPGYEMNRAVILPKGPKSDPRGHWRSLKRRQPEGTVLVELYSIRLYIYT
jgi:hypothetical protein